jgi:hypothetical protein
MTLRAALCMLFLDGGTGRREEVAMRGGVVVWLGCAALLCGVAVAGAEVAGRELDDDDLVVEMTRNRTLAAYVERNGEPDVAEKHFLADRPPWEREEVTLYYLDARKEIGFARAAILGRPEIHLVRYERALTDAQVAALSHRARPRTLAAVSGDPADRAEAAAQRAEDAAGRVEAAAGTAENAADRAEAVVAKIESAFHRSLLK